MCRRLVLCAASILLCTSAISAMSRRHPDATPYLDDVTNAMWSDDVTSDVSDGELPSPLRGNGLNEGKVRQSFEDACASHFCDRGKTCHLTKSGQPTCQCRAFCPRHRKLVCGTDGRLYLNHCELHRTACAEGSRVHIDRAKRCLRRELTPITWSDRPETATLPPLTLVEQVSPRLLPKDDPLQFGETVLTTPPSNETYPEVSHRVVQNMGAPIEPSPSCTMEQYEILKDNLLYYHHTRLLADHGPGSDRAYLVGIMFSHFDSNNNGHLDQNELIKISKEKGTRALSEGCTLTDLLQFDDTDSDGRLSLNEFDNAFSKFYSVSVVSLDKSLEINPVTARVGDNLEMNCAVTGTPKPPIVWRRNGIDLAALNSEDIRVFADGSLYLTHLQLVHAGNYTCHADRNKEVVQTHVLSIHTVPSVQVTPHIQSLRPGDEAVMWCRATGQPFPKVEWLKNDEPLRMDIPNKYHVEGNSTQLRVRNIGYADTGAFMCQVTSVGGMARDISSLVVQENPTPSGSQQENQRFFVFHDWGAAIYEPEECRLFHVIQGTDIIPGTQDYMCGDKGTNCSWGRAIPVGQHYVYVSQPTRDRVLVISVEQMVVVDVIVTDQYPVDLSYVQNLDQVWVLNWRSTKNEGVKTIQVIRDASEKRKHHTVHPEPIDGHFDLVNDCFVPKIQDLGHEFRYAYVTHTNQRGLYKLDLANMKYIKTVDLTPYNCVPQHLVFSALYGLVVMECSEPVTGHHTGQLVLDYLTDAILSHKNTLTGRPHITPDSAYIVTVDSLSKSRIVVQRVTGFGLEYMYDVSTSLNLTDVAFFPARNSHSYDMFASSGDKEDTLFLELHAGKVEMITGVGPALPPSMTIWNNPNRQISSAGIFNHFLVSPGADGIYVLNGKTLTVNCEIGSMVHPRMAVWVDGDNA